jgi:hypothetical protein
MKTFALCFPSRRALGFRLIEECRPNKNADTDDAVDLRCKVGAIDPKAKGLEMLKEGDVLFHVGYKNEYMKSWQWELLLGFSLEDVIAAIGEAKQSNGRLSLRFFRPERDQEGGWSDSSPADKVENLNALPREKNLERKRSEPESSSVRVGLAYQCTTFPSPTRKGVKSKEEALCESDDSVAVFLPSKIPSKSLTEYMNDLFPPSSKVSAAESEFALGCLHESGYSVENAKAKFALERDARIRELDWTPEMVDAFVHALQTIKCRDFALVKAEMAEHGFQLQVGDLVAYYYTTFKCTQQYRDWSQSIKPDDEDSGLNLCLKCEEDDPNGEAVYCIKCSVRFRHMECFNPPLTKDMLSDARFRRWTCEDCSRPPSSARKSGNQASRLLSGLGASDGNGVSSSGTSARKAAQAASSMFASLNDAAPLRPKRAASTNSSKYEDGDDDDDEDLNGRKKQRPGSYDEEGRRLHTLKGVAIQPKELIRLVEEKGGYDAVMEKKLWQSIRKELDLPHTTSSSYQLREAYVDYVKHTAPSNGKAKI